MSVFPWLWVNGKRVARDDFSIDPFDEGLLYGRGLFETTRTINGTPWLWDAHQQRLIAAARFLGIPIDDATLPTTTEAQEFALSLRSEDVVLRLNVTAGAFDRPGMVWMMARPLPSLRRTVRLRTSDFRVSMHDPYASHKSLSYATRLEAQRRAQAAGADDALLLDPSDLVLEAATANLFVRLPEGWCTPPLTGGVLNGTVRELLLDHGEPPAIRARGSRHPHR
jgi:branched-subunit amino acid aminotransferase/4-amino-4-deoxychorismate lyase